MPGFFTDYLNNKVLDLVLGGSSLLGPTTVYVGLSLGASNKAGSISEPSFSAGYSRIAVANTLVNFPAASNGTKSNANPVSFPSPTASWGTIVSVFLADAMSGGNILAMADLSLPKSVSSGNGGPRIATNAMFLSHT